MGKFLGNRIILGQTLWDVWWGVGPIFLELLLCWDDAFGSFPLQLGMEQAGISSMNWLCLLLNGLLSTSPKKAVSAHSWQNSHVPVNPRCEQTVALAAKPSCTSGLISRALYSKAPGASHVFISTHSCVKIVAVLVGN